MHRDIDWTTLIESIRDSKRIAGLTHDFYRYPARFSPTFASNAIRAFTDPGDYILDPFVGGGTSAIEATALGRFAVGLDISRLAVFVSKAKSTPLSQVEKAELLEFCQQLPPYLSLRRSVERPHSWIEAGYLRNIDSREAWPIRKTLELYINSVGNLRTPSQRRFARCVALRTAQWALDGRRTIPGVRDFRIRMTENFESMLTSLEEFATAAIDSLIENGRAKPRFPRFYHISSATAHSRKKITRFGPPKLILTSPPYPGVHVLYHRWQVLGRRETPAPFWIADVLDGSGASYYTFGDRTTHVKKQYFTMLHETFASLSELAAKDTFLVQLVGFPNNSSLLGRYLQVLSTAGWSEVQSPRNGIPNHVRPWRRVPNRKWYLEANKTLGASREVLLVHVKGD